MFYALFILLLTGTVFSVHSAPAKRYPKMRVVNGTNAMIQKYPFMASLHCLNQHFCGSVIIDPKWVITAAHCIEILSEDLITVQYGSSNIKKTAKNVSKVKRIIIHQNYTKHNFYPNDIALLELESAIIFNHRTVGSINLPTKYFNLPQAPKERAAVLVGWGLNATNGVPQEILQEITLPVLSADECNKRLRGKYRKSNLCVDTRADGGAKGQCRGDSGGPLIYKDNLLIGIVSWSIKPSGSFPGVFTKVSHYVDWIKENMK